jgi:hypothetical protein
MDREIPLGIGVVKGVKRRGWLGTHIQSRSLVRPVNSLAGSARYYIFASVLGNFLTAFTADSTTK